VIAPAFTVTVSVCGAAVVALGSNVGVRVAGVEPEGGARPTQALPNAVDAVHACAPPDPVFAIVRDAITEGPEASAVSFTLPGVTVSTGPVITTLNAESGEN